MKEIKEPEAYRFIYERLNKTLDGLIDESSKEFINIIDKSLENITKLTLEDITKLTDESLKEFINIINELRIENLQLKSKIQDLEHILKENNIEIDKKLTMKF